MQTNVCFCSEKTVTKKILRFYFGADSLERAFDNLIINKALSFEADTLKTVDRLCEMVGEKIRLEELWTYLDGIISPFSVEEREMLLRYCARRDEPLSDRERRACKRAVIKFTRHARRLGRFAGAVSILKKYYCLIVAGK